MTFFGTFVLLLKIMCILVAAGLVAASWRNLARKKEQRPHWFITIGMLALAIYLVVFALIIMPSLMPAPPVVRLK